MTLIDQAEVEHIAHLARLQLAAEEKANLTSQLDRIFDYFQQLNQLDPELVDVMPTTRAIPTVNVTRPDLAEPFPDREQLLDGAPHRQEDFFQVPQIMT
ncbi:MAG: Asp-tRNA(Asn)/Glu-tRNA(Gln) amidotransferase subunit GatC [Pseudanabaenaceae cyanobacterium bins.68]|nr:Asp-tRNA(Asn)/Glu-tRNA(Gln) amidotransferase subunit GatC [Pseudanabaenaceae cyanobacterium bins.68]